LIGETALVKVLPSKNIEESPSSGGNLLEAVKGRKAATHRLLSDLPTHAVTTGLYQFSIRLRFNCDSGVLMGSGAVDPHGDIAPQVMGCGNRQSSVAGREPVETICAPWFHRYNDGMSTSNETRSVLVGYILWIFGFTGSHRFYYGKPITGTIWFFTGGLLLIGWINVVKDATLACGLVVKVPLFIRVGDQVKVDTTTHKYMGKEGGHR
jgi:TM2 domain-containing membrane protein YozV